ncbi:ABC transporter substrate-binding protein [Vibrio viridaestus]|uniref:ABC transporter substrate-binding protein n=1 Tax=Vibrio viridaestus TaxID=2487322 RepID=A0A3N9TEJ8_9VIBR|nr:ABC transporter substrate-binding protein [Vibrio viridaestus]RQW61875.1 ABC transporter substrate-binding protein [Vibrio viridaestus]
MKDQKIITGQECINDFERLTRQGRSRRSLLKSLGAAGLVLAASGTAISPFNVFAQDEGKSTSNLGKPGGKIKVASLSISTADTLDPAKGAFSTDYTRHYMVYNGLTKFDDQLVPHLELAESIENDQATVWHVKLKKGISFHDGKELTADDVVFSLNRHKDPVTASKVMGLAKQIKSVEATNKYEVTITLEGPNAEFPSILAISHMLIVPANVTDFNKGIGTGPFKLAEFKPGITTVVTKNENYWKPGLPYLDQVELFAIADEPSRVNALLSGEVHVISEVNPRSTDRIESSSGHEFINVPSGNYTDLIVRQDMMPGKSADFTEGMKLLMDREQIKSAIFQDFATIGNDTPIAPGARYYNSDLKQRSFDPDKAKFLIKKAGFADAKIPLVASNAAAGSVDIAVLMQQSAAKVGIKLDVQTKSIDGYWSNHWAKHPLSFGNINARPSADIIFSQFFLSSAAWNESHWKNTAFDKLLIDARKETDESRRAQMYAEMQTLVHDNSGIGVPIFISKIDGIDSRLKGYGTNPLGSFMGYMFAEKVWLDA